MNFKKYLKLGALLVLFFSIHISAAEVALTMDDGTVADTPTMTGVELDAGIRSALRAEKIQAAFFVAGRNVDSEAGRALLKRWDDDGHVLANHSYSHKYFNSKDVTVDFLKSDILKTEELLKPFKNFKKLFRFPYLKEGETAEKRDRIQEFLKTRGYMNGAVTIDASDWYISDRLKKRLEKNKSADTTAYRDFYLEHIWDRSQYYNDLARKVLGREVKHTLLIHHNLLNALYLKDVIRMYKAKGWKVINAESAFQDEAFKKSPNTLPAGESLIWALAKETGKFELRYPGEDGPYEKLKMDKRGL